MDTQNVKPPLSDIEPNMRDLFNVIWLAKYQIIIVTFIFAVSSVLYSLSLPNYYKATTLLAPVQSDGGGLSGALGQLGGLASLAGVNIDGSERSESKIAQEIMKSWSFIDEFVINNNITVEIFAAEGWNKTSNTLKFNNKIFDQEKGRWLLVDDKSDEFRPPTSWEIFEKFSQMLSISEDKLSGLVTVSLEYYSPQLAQTWLDMYVQAINKHMQVRRVVQVTNNIEYLELQVSKTSIAEMREVFYTLIEEQIKNKMVAEASPDYAFTALGKSMIPEIKSRPKRAIICILGTLLGGFLSVLLVLFKHFGKRK